MDTIGLDLHKRESQLCTVTEDGEVLEQRIPTSRTRLTTAFGGRPRARILLEATTESEWVARHLESLGHEVIVADPNFAPMYATRSRRVKTDRRDARTLADACRLGAYRPAHRVSDAQRHVRAELTVRDALVRTRTRYVSLVRSLVRRDGQRVPGCDVEHVPAPVQAMEDVLPSMLRSELEPILAMLAPLNTAVAAADARIAALVAGDPVVQRLTTMPGIGPITAAAFVATLDDVARFATAHQVQAFLGLVPAEHSSGERQQRGRITKAGSRRLRWLLVEAAWRVRRSRRADVAGLRAWAERIAARRGKRIAGVALARRLAGILYAMWRDGKSFAPAACGQAPVEVAA